jgi:hypothetical protein
MQWAVAIGRIDITTATMTLSGYRALPRKGHLERAKRVVSYLAKMKHGAIRFRVAEPDYSDLHEYEYIGQSQSMVTSAKINRQMLQYHLEST